LTELMRRSEDVLARCVEAIRAGRPPQHVPKLRPVQESFRPVAREQPDRVGGAEVAGALLDATDRVANSLDTLAAEVRRQLAQPAGIAS
jgi:hypothetical protein